MNHARRLRCVDRADSGTLRAHDLHRCLQRFALWGADRPPRRNIGEDFIAIERRISRHKNGKQDISAPKSAIQWLVLRRSFGCWHVIQKTHPKALQGLMRHSRIQTTMDIYTQFIPHEQRAEQQTLPGLPSGQPVAQPAYQSVQ